MFPIRDTIRSRSFPIVTWGIIVLNVLVFVFETSLSPGGLNHLFDQFGLVPAHIVWTNPLTWYPFLSHMFLHGGWVHLISNMWTLAIFGDNVEERLGSFRFLLFYLLGGLAAGGLQFVLGGSPVTPSIGASGAIAAVLGAYFLFFPRSKVTTLILLVVYPWFVNIPAVIYLGIWFISQLFSGLSSLAPSAAAAQSIAVWAHVGGFLFGLAVAYPFTIGRLRKPDRQDEYRPL